MSIVCVVCFNYHIEKVIALKPGEINLSGRIKPLQYSEREAAKNNSVCNSSVNLFWISWTDVFVFKNQLNLFSLLILACLSLLILSYPSYYPLISLPNELRTACDATFKFYWMLPHYWTMNKKWHFKQQIPFSCSGGSSQYTC